MHQTTKIISFHPFTKNRQPRQSNSNIIHVLYKNQIFNTTPTRPAQTEQINANIISPQNQIPDEHAYDDDVLRRCDERQSCQPLGERSHQILREMRRSQEQVG